MNVKYKQYGFTLVELLTVLAIISMLVGLLIPTITLVRNTAKNAKQRVQITTIDNALMVWRNDHGKYPESEKVSGTAGLYCGAQKLAEALMGRDLMGFHPKSTFDADGIEYDMAGLTEPQIEANLKKRQGPYLELGTASAFRLGDDSSGTGGPGLFKNPMSLVPDAYVLCDVFGVRRIKVGQGKTVTAGTPILYYKANTSRKKFDENDWNNSIYNADDNLPLLALNKLTPDGKESDDPDGHPLYSNGSGEYFYDENYKIIDQKIWLATGGTSSGKLWPHRPDSYILISAGVDGEYGTPDDICNF